jgi:hypothetical protein
MFFKVPLLGTNQKFQMKNILLALLLNLVLTVLFKANAQVDTINIAKNDLVTSALKPGLHQYLVYFENPKKKRLGNPSLWNREVKFKKVNGEDMIEIEQNWYGSDTLFNRYVYSIAKKKTFEPVYHKTIMRGVTEAFDFTDKKISGSDSVKNNAKADLEIDQSVQTLNWELDLEIFSTLPIKKTGQRFFINFYHPGGKTPPKYYEYSIMGDDKIKVINDQEVDCWKMKIEYGPNSWAIFWIGKKSKEVFKMQEFFGGGYRYKVKLGTSMRASTF